MTTTIANHRPSVTAWRTLMVSEAKMVIRDTSGLLIPIALPMLIMLATSASVGNEMVRPGVSAVDMYVLPVVLIMAIAIIGIINMPSMMAGYRRAGVLKRIGTTPASPSMILISQAVVGAIQALIGTGIAVATAMLAFNASAPSSPFVAVLVLTLCLVAMYGVGMIIASLAPTVNAALALSMLAFLGLGAVGGMFGQRENLPDAMATLGEYLPFGAGVEAITAAWIGEPVQAMHLIVLAATAAIGAVISVMFFRWDR